MNVGFNTDVRVGGRSYHVQTEDRGAHHLKIDTAVYVGGRVVHKHSTSYSELEGGVERVRTFGACASKNSTAKSSKRSVPGHWIWGNSSRPRQHRKGLRRLRRNRESRFK